MRCHQCGAEIDEGSVFCHQCGARVGGEELSAAPVDKFRPVGNGTQQDTVEEQLWEGRYSKLAMIGSWIAAAVFSGIVLIVAVAAKFDGTGWLASLGVIALVWIWLIGLLLYRQFSVSYSLSNQRFVHEGGLLWKQIDRIEAIDIDDVAYRQGPIERIMGVGTISIHSSDQSHPILDLPGIENVKEIAAIIDNARRQERIKRGIHVEAV